MSLSSGFRHLLASLALAATVTGCAAIGPQACAPRDWYATGVTDGRVGAPEQRGTKLAANCAAEGVAFDQSQYDAGRSAGLLEYCTVTGGVNAGRSARTYYDVCRGHNEQDFKSGYYLGALSSAP